MKDTQVLLCQDIWVDLLIDRLEMNSVCVCGRGVGGGGGSTPCHFSEPTWPVWA